MPLEEQARVVQGDSVCGYRENTHDLLSLHLVAQGFQFFLLKEHENPKATVALLDDLEKTMGSAEAFEAVFGIMLFDRWTEFEDFEGMERSCLDPDRARYRVFYCDLQETNQKSQA